MFFGYCPPQVKDLAEKHLVEVHPGVPLLNYAMVFNQLQLQAVVAPIKKTEFNFCKSHIKTMECAALGVPLFATNCLPYSRVMSPAQLFDTAQELKDKLVKLKFMNTNHYRDLIQKQWDWLNSPCDEGDFHLNNYWLEDNMNNVWMPLFKMRQKGLKISLKNFMQQYQKRLDDERAKTLFVSKSGKARVMV